MKELPKSNFSDTTLFFIFIAAMIRAFFKSIF